MEEGYAWVVVKHIALPMVATETLKSRSRVRVVFILMNTLVLLLRERKLELCTFFCRAGRLFHHNTSCMPA